LTLALAAGESFGFLFVGAAGLGAGGLGGGFFARGALYLFAFCLVFNRLCICHWFPCLWMSRGVRYRLA
ncbi:MAG: hypothetical protein WBD10_11605, partial [Acidobacteriaceae bacterium]